MDDDEIPLDRRLGPDPKGDAVEEQHGFEKISRQIEARRRIIRAERRARMFVAAVEIGLGIVIALLVISLLFR